MRHQSAESGLLKDLGDRIRTNPGYLCFLSGQCVDLVKEGIAVYIGVYAIINQDYSTFFFNLNSGIIIRQKVLS